MTTVSNFVNQHFSPDDLQQLRDAIACAERASTGEIKVTVEQRCQGEPLQRARQLFELHGLHKTRRHNAVLIALFVDDRRFAILGDEGINSRVKENFWHDTAAEMERHMRQGHFKEALLVAIHSAGEKLASFFPPEPEDVNELSNEIC